MFSRKVISLWLILHYITMGFICKIENAPSFLLFTRLPLLPRFSAFPQGSLQCFFPAAGSVISLILGSLLKNSADQPFGHFPQLILKINDSLLIKHSYLYSGHAGPE